MSVVDVSRMQEIEARYPEILHRSFRQRFGALMIFMGVILYGVYAVWFFDLPKVIAEAHWERVGIYLSQWISYDVQPEFRISGDKISVKYPRYSPLGDDPHPDWVTNNPDGSLTVSVSGTGRTVTVTKTQAILTAHGVTVPIDITGDSPKVLGSDAPPSWITVYDDNI
ncbi:phosphonate ABC transporter, permease protein PhnE, partial [Rhizobium jaguaris]